MSVEDLIKRFGGDNNHNRSENNPNAGNTKKVARKTKEIANRVNREAPVQGQTVTTKLPPAPTGHKFKGVISPVPEKSEPKGGASGVNKKSRTKASPSKEVLLKEIFSLSKVFSDTQNKLESNSEYRDVIRLSPISLLKKLFEKYDELSAVFEEKENKVFMINIQDSPLKTGHLVVVIIMKDKVILCNRGDAVSNNNLSGISYYSIRVKSKRDSLVQKISNIGSFNYTGFKTVTHTEAGEMLKSFGERENHILQDPQLTGNCTTRSILSAAKALFIEKHGNQKGKALSKNLSTNFKIMSAKEMLKNISKLLKNYDKKIDNNTIKLLTESLVHTYIDIENRLGIDTNIDKEINKQLARIKKYFTKMSIIGSFDDMYAFIFEEILRGKIAKLTKAIDISLVGSYDKLISLLNRTLKYRDKCPVNTVNIEIFINNFIELAKRYIRESNDKDKIESVITLIILTHELINDSASINSLINDSILEGKINTKLVIKIISDELLKEQYEKIIQHILNIKIKNSSELLEEIIKSKTTIKNIDLTYSIVNKYISKVEHIDIKILINLVMSIKDTYGQNIFLQALLKTKGFSKKEEFCLSLLEVKSFSAEKNIFTLLKANITEKKISTKLFLKSINFTKDNDSLQLNIVSSVLMYDIINKKEVTMSILSNKHLITDNILFNLAKYFVDIDHNLTDSIISKCSPNNKETLILNISNVAKDKDNFVSFLLSNISEELSINLLISIADIVSINTKFKIINYANSITSINIVNLILHILNASNFTDKLVLIKLILNNKKITINPTLIFNLSKQCINTNTNKIDIITIKLILEKAKSIKMNIEHLVNTLLQNKISNSEKLKEQIESKKQNIARTTTRNTIQNIEESNNNVEEQEESKASDENQFDNMSLQEIFTKLQGMISKKNIETSMVLDALNSITDVEIQLDLLNSVLGLESVSDECKKIIIKKVLSTYTNFTSELDSVLKIFNKDNNFIKYINLNDVLNLVIKNNQDPFYIVFNMFTKQYISLKKLLNSKMSKKDKRTIIASSDIELIKNLTKLHIESIKENDDDVTSLLFNIVLKSYSNKKEHEAINLLKNLIPENIKVDLVYNILLNIEDISIVFARLILNLVSKEEQINILSDKQLSNLRNKLKNNTAGNR